jgi:hypothetical protein
MDLIGGNVCSDEVGFELDNHHGRAADQELV